MGPKRHVRGGASGPRFVQRSITHRIYVGKKKAFFSNILVWGLTAASTGTSSQWHAERAGGGTDGCMYRCAFAGRADCNTPHAPRHAKNSS